MFLQDRIITDNLLVQLVRLKQVIIGGPANKLTVSDIERFIVFVNVLKKEAVFFQPYIKMLNTRNYRQTDHNEDLTNAIEWKFKKSISRISGFLKEFSMPYLISDITALVRELNLFFDNHSVPYLNEKMKLTGALKQFIVGGSDSVVKPEEWEDFLLGYSFLTSIMVNYALFNKQENAVSPASMRYVSMIFKDVLDLLSLTLKNRPKKRINESDFLKPIQLLRSAHIIPTKLTEQAVQNLLIILFGKVFNTQKDRYGIVELTPNQLNKMRKVLLTWTGIQSFLDSLSRNNHNFSHKHLTDPSQLKPFFSSKGTLSEGVNTINQMLSLKPLYAKGSKIHLSRQVYFETETKQKMDYKNLTIYNFYHLISTIMKWGYEKDYPNSPGMSQEELKNFFTDFNIIAENMGWFQNTAGRALSAGEAEFIAANMLTADAHGFHSDFRKEEYLTANEIAGYLAYAISFGFLFSDIDKALLKLCVEPGANNKDDERRYHIECVRFHLLPELEKHTNNMPDLQKIFSQMNEERKSAFTQALIYISFETEEEYQKAVYLTPNHLKNISMALYFVETTIGRYDLNGDLELQHEEILYAYPTFQGYLSRVLVYLLCRPTDALSPSMYSYVVKKHHLPPSRNVIWYDRWYAYSQLKIHQYLYSADKHLWDLHLNHETLTIVFSTLIKGFLAKKRTAKTCGNPEKTEIYKKPVATFSRHFGRQ